jgi:mannonate dehydratase
MAMKLGVSHQTPETLTEERLKYLISMGVESMEVRLDAQDATFDNIMSVKKKVEAAGIELHEIILNDVLESDDVTLGGEHRDEIVARFKRFITDLGRAGIKHTTYAWNTGGKAYETHRAQTRGIATRRFETVAALALPNEHERTYDDDFMWQTYEAFVNEVLPIAKAADVRLQLHPNDPPLNNRGIARIFRSVEAFRRGMDIGGNSPYNGALFCVGTFGQMPGPEGQGENIPGAIREFGAKGLIHLVHLRNVDNHMPNFNETFPDNGWIDFMEIAEALADIDFEGVIVPDHVPETLDGGVSGEAYVFGYLRAMIQYAERLKAAK